MGLVTSPTAIPREGRGGTGHWTLQIALIAVLLGLVQLETASVPRNPATALFDGIRRLTAQGTVRPAERVRASLKDLTLT